MRIVFFGSAQFGVPCLEAIDRSQHELVGIFTQPARPAGRKRELRPTEVALWASAHGCNCIEAENINQPNMVELVAACRGDLLVVIAFGQKIGHDVIDLFSKGAINVHASLLPKYRGAGPIYWALMNGESETGVTIITLADKMDAGLMLGRGKTSINPQDTSQTLHDRLSEVAVPTLMHAIDQIDAGTAVYTPQDESQVTLAPKLKKIHGYIDWNKPAGAVVNQIRALWPWPGAQAVYVSSATGRSNRVIIRSARPVSCRVNCTPGTLNGDLNICCGQDAICIEELKPAGSHLMSYESFVNGRASQPGDLFLPVDHVLREVL